MILHRIFIQMTMRSYIYVGMYIAYQWITTICYFCTEKKDCGKHVCHCGRLNILKSDFLYFIVNFSAKFYMDLPLTPCCHSSKVQEIGFHFKFTAMAYIFSAFFFLCVLLFEALKLAFQTRFRCSWNNKKFNKMQLFHWHFFLSNNYYHTQH